MGPNPKEQQPGKETEDGRPEGQRVGMHVKEGAVSGVPSCGAVRTGSSVGSGSGNVSGV